MDLLCHRLCWLLFSTLYFFNTNSRGSCGTRGAIELDCILDSIVVSPVLNQSAPSILPLIAPQLVAVNRCGPGPLNAIHNIIDMHKEHVWSFPISAQFGANPYLPL